MDTSSSFIDTKLWGCNFYSQLASAAIIEADYEGASTALQNGFAVAVEFGVLELQVFIFCFSFFCLFVFPLLI